MKGHILKDAETLESKKVSQLQLSLQSEHGAEIQAPRSCTQAQSWVEGARDDLAQAGGEVEVLPPSLLAPAAALQGMSRRFVTTAGPKGAQHHVHQSCAYGGALLL
eukprot:5167877-Amphidinium_carterae.1